MVLYIKNLPLNNFEYKNAICLTVASGSSPTLFDELVGQPRMPEISPRSDGSCSDGLYV
jgi:hypothetical protein